MSIVQKIRSKKYFLAGAITLIICLSVGAIITGMNAYAEEQLWDVKVGDKTVAVLNTETSANEVIEKVKNYYVKEGATVQSIICDPAMTVEQKNYAVGDSPKVMEVEDAVEYIVTGTLEPTPYTVKKDESPWSIAQNHGITIDELKAMNPEKDFSKLYPGDILNLNQSKPFVNVTTVQLVTSDKTIEAKTVYKESSDVAAGTEIVKEEGKNGKAKVTELITTENGKTVKTVVKERKVIKKAEDQVVIKGTGTTTSNSYSSYKSSGTVYSGNGSGIANFALQFVGNPYAYGGSSLTNGSDCSGFVMSVYRNFGVSLPHGAGSISGYGRSVSLSQAQPGDVIYYGFHVSIYIGGGREVHAVNEGMGIAVTNVGYVGGVLDVRRIVE